MRLLSFVNREGFSVVDYSRSSSRGAPTEEIILWEELGPVDRRVRRVLYDAGILSSLNIVVDDWAHHWRDEVGEFGFMIGIDTAAPTGGSVPPYDAMLTVACEAQGPRDEQERRLLAVLLSIREVLVHTGSFEFVLMASDRLYAREQEGTPRFRRSHLGFNVTDVELLREERQWNDA